MTDGTLLRTVDPVLLAMNTGGARVELGAGVTMAQVLANRDLAFLHPSRARIGGPAVRTMATVGGNLFAPTPYGDFTAALLALDATVDVQGGYGGARAQPLEEIPGEPRPRQRARSLASTFNRPANPDAFRFRKVVAREAQGHLGAVDRRAPAAERRTHRGARVAYGAMAPTPMRAKAVERALEGRSLDAAGIAPRRSRRGRRHQPRDRRARERLVSPRDGAGAPRRLLLGENAEKRA